MITRWLEAQHTGREMDIRELGSTDDRTKRDDQTTEEAIAMENEIVQARNDDSKRDRRRHTRQGEMRQRDNETAG